METLDSVKLELDAERHNHKKDNEFLLAENTKLREALRRIIAEADSDDGLTAWDGADIAREALKEWPR